MAVTRQSWYSRSVRILLLTTVFLSPLHAVGFNMDYPLDDAQFFTTAPNVGSYGACEPFSIIIVKIRRGAVIMSHKIVFVGAAEGRWQAVCDAPTGGWLEGDGSVKATLADADDPTEITRRVKFIKP